MIEAQGQEIELELHIGIQGRYLTETCHSTLHYLLSFLRML